MIIQLTICGFSWAYSAKNNGYSFLNSIKSGSEIIQDLTLVLLYPSLAYFLSKYNVSPNSIKRLPQHPAPLLSSFSSLVKPNDWGIVVGSNISEDTLVPHPVNKIPIKMKLKPKLFLSFYFFLFF